MGADSKIEWTDSTWNPWRGCDKVDPACAYCYMFRDQERYGRDPSVVVRCSPQTFNVPLSRAWAAKRAECIEARGQHLVFTCSWSDWFHEDADAWRPEAWEIIRRCPDSTFQILTKRPERIAEHLPADWGDGWPNVWLGVTIGNRRGVGRADILRDTPAAVRFISAEPLLGPLLPDGAERWDGELTRAWADGYTGPGLDLAEIGWLIVGGESGGPPARRLVDVRNRPREQRARWVRDLRDATQTQQSLECCRMRDPLGRCCQQPDDNGPWTLFLFKQWGGGTPTSGGRLLDGRTWDEIPNRRFVEAAAHG